MIDDVDLLICGAGPVGCVMAERAASFGWTSLVVDRRSHVAGNCHDSQHASGVLIHNYGPHYFRTNDEGLVRYLSRFTEWSPASYVVRSSVAGQLYPFPINLSTLEMFFGRALDAESAASLLNAERVPMECPANSEEFVLSRVGRRMFDAFYKNYTQKQWGRSAAELGPSVCGRIPIRFNRDDRYVDHRFQMMPAAGFTALFAKMLDHPNIRVLLGEDYHDLARWVRPRIATVYAGPIDAYFGHRFGALPYRSLRFEWETHDAEFVQPCVQINHPNEHAYTRTVEIKHVTGQRLDRTVISKEYPTDKGEPFYPVPTAESQSLFQRYAGLAAEETRRRRVYFCGRLAQYRYFNTDEVITEALRCFQDIRAQAFGRPSSSRGLPTAA